MARKKKELTPAEKRKATIAAKAELEAEQEAAAEQRRANMRKAIGHPARMQAMRLFAPPVENGDEPTFPLVSPKELAAVMELPLPNVSYHTKILRELGVIELKKTTPRRGAVEHHYSLVPEVRPLADAALVLLG